MTLAEKTRKMELARDLRNQLGEEMWAILYGYILEKFAQGIPESIIGGGLIVGAQCTPEAARAYLALICPAEPPTAPAAQQSPVELTEPEAESLDCFLYGCGDPEHLKEAFLWRQTPQGHDYWAARYSNLNLITPEDIAYLESLLARAQGTLV